MKTIIYSAIFLGFISLESCSNKVPENILETFNNQFSTAEDIVWSKENDTTWEVEFELNNIEYAALLNEEGHIIEIEHEVYTDEIPTEVLSVLNKNFESYQIEESEISEKNNKIFYEFELEDSEDSFEVVIDENGNYEVSKIE